MKATLGLAVSRDPALTIIKYIDGQGRVDRGENVFNPRRDAGSVATCRLTLLETSRGVGGGPTATAGPRRVVSAAQVLNKLERRRRGW